MIQSTATLPGWPYRTAAVDPLPAALPDGSPWPRISIVTPSFNQGEYLEETILSVARQNYPNVEHIVVDGGSTDQTLEIIERHRSDLAYFVSEPDRGQSHALNKGFTRATGEILTWLNSDDLLAPGALAAVALAFHTSGADLVAGIASLFSEDRFIEHHLTSCDDGPLPLEDLLDLERCWLAGQFFYQPEVMFSRRIWELAGGTLREDLFYSMDYDLWVRFAERGARLHVIGRPVAWYRVHAGQKTSVSAGYETELRQWRENYARKHSVDLNSSRRPAPPPRRLRILALNDHGFHYGAGLAHHRLATSLAAAGHTVQGLALADGPYDGPPLALPSKEELLRVVSSCAPDLVLVGNLHAVGADPEILAQVAARHKTLLVLHDLWWLTGRCAFPETCAKNLTGCDGSCPTPHEYPKLAPAAIAQAWQKRRALFAAAGGPKVVGYSKWASDFAARTLAAWQLDPRRAAEVSLGFPLDTFTPRDKRAARLEFDLPETGFIVMIPGDPYDRRKRVMEVIEALRRLDLPDLTVVSLGHARENEKFPLKDVRRLGYFPDPERLSRIYSAADLMVSASRDETLGQVYLEAIACGTPVIGYQSSGIGSAICHGVTGLLVEPLSPEGLAAGIRHLYENAELRSAIGRWGRIHVENEFSFQAAYRRFFSAWRRLGLVEQLQLPPKISFRVNAAASISVETVGAPAKTTFAAGIDEGSTYPARPSAGIDFRLPGRPSFATRFVGLSYPENWGRWTDGSRVEIHFARPLPRRFRIEIQAGAYAENAHRPILISAGAAATEIRITFDPTLGESTTSAQDGPVESAPRLPLHVAEVESSGRETVLAIEIPEPACPALVWPGLSSDWRRLGLALQTLRIVEVGTLRAWFRQNWSRLQQLVAGPARGD